MRKAVFLDRDGVINRTIFRNGKPRAPDRVEEFELFPGVPEAVARLRAAGFLIVVVTNQPDVARGWQTRANVEAMNEIVQSRLGVDGLKVCYHVDADGCPCRKPLPGMLVEAAAELGIDFGSSYMVGDRRGDIEAGRAAGCLASLWVESGPAVVSDFSADFSADARVDSLSAATDWILARG